MDYYFAKSEFERLLKEINELLRKPKVEYLEADPLAEKMASLTWKRLSQERG